VVTGYPTVKKFSKHIYFLYRIHERDRRTERQRDKWTDAHHTTAQTATLMHYINNFVQWNYKTNSSFEVTTHNYHIKRLYKYVSITAACTLLCGY